MPKDQRRASIECAGPHKQARQEKVLMHPRTTVITIAVNEKDVLLWETAWNPQFPIED